MEDRYANVYGIDMPSRKELVAHGRTVPEISEDIGADLVVFQTLPDLVQSCSQFNPAISQFDCSVFTGEYITGGVDRSYLDHVESVRSDNVKNKAKSFGINPEVPLLGGQQSTTFPQNPLQSKPLNGLNGLEAYADSSVYGNGCSGPMSGAESLIGLAPSLEPPNLTNESSSANTNLGLASSFHSSMSLEEAVAAAHQFEEASERNAVESDGAHSEFEGHEFQ